MNPTIPFPPLLRSGLAAAALLLACVHPAAAQTVFRVNSGASNTSGSTLTINHPALNGKPKIKPLITQFWSGIYNPHPVGVQYDTASARWQIVNEDNAAIPVDAKFNVLIANGTKTVLASPTNTIADITFFPTAKGIPTARLFFTHVTNPVVSLPSTFSTRFHGLYYIPAGPGYGGQWSVFAENTENMEAIGFHVADLSKLKNGTGSVAFLYSATGANVNGHIATIDNALTNGNPNAFVYVQHVWLPTSPNYLDESLGVYYTGGKWHVFNQDGSAMPGNIAFVVAVFPGTGV